MNCRLRGKFASLLSQIVSWLLMVAQAMYLNIYIPMCNTQNICENNILTNADYFANFTKI